MNVVDLWTILSIQAVNHVPGFSGGMAADLAVHPRHGAIKSAMFGFFLTQLSNIYRKNKVEVGCSIFHRESDFDSGFYMRYLMEFIGKCPFPSSSLERLLSHVRTPALRASS